MPSQLNGKRAPGVHGPVQPRCPRNGTADDEAFRRPRQRRRSHHWRREPSGRSPTSLRQPGYRPASGPSLVLGPCRMRPRGSGRLPLAGSLHHDLPSRGAAPFAASPRAHRARFVLSSSRCGFGSDRRAAAGPTAALAPVVVTGTREPEAIGRGTADVVVIDAETIRDTSADSVEDLIRRAAGMQVVRNGGPGQNSGFFIRGSSTNSTVVLIDGVRVGSATLGQAEFEPVFGNLGHAVRGRERSRRRQQHRHRPRRQGAP